MATIYKTTITIETRVQDEYDGEIDALLDNLRITCENVCDSAVKELGLPEAGLEVTVL